MTKYINLYNKANVSGKQLTSRADAACGKVQELIRTAERVASASTVDCSAPMLDAIHYAPEHGDGKCYGMTNEGKILAAGSVGHVSHYWMRLSPFEVQQLTIRIEAEERRYSDEVATFVAEVEAADARAIESARELIDSLVPGHRADATEHAATADPYREAKRLVTAHFREQTRGVRDIAISDQLRISDQQLQFLCDPTDDDDDDRWECCENERSATEAAIIAVVDNWQLISDAIRLDTEAQEREEAQSLADWQSRLQRVKQFLELDSEEKNRSFDDDGESAFVSVC